MSLKVKALILVFLVGLLVTLRLFQGNNFQILNYLVLDWLEQSNASNIAYGSSTIANYRFSSSPCGPWLQRGLSNATISDFLSYVTWQPKNERIKNVVVYLGENDLAENQALNDVVANYGELIDKLVGLYENASIHILGLKFSPARKEFWSEFSMLDAYIRDVSVKKSNIHYHSLQMLNSISDKVFLPDGIHLNQAGYSIIFSGVNSECRS